MTEGVRTLGTLSRSTVYMTVALNQLGHVSFGGRIAIRHRVNRSLLSGAAKEVAPSVPSGAFLFSVV